MTPPIRHLTAPPQLALGADHLKRAVSADDVEWQLKGLCRDYDPEPWFSTKVNEQRIAKKICLGCPVILQCREWALDKHEFFGVWGGMTSDERFDLWKVKRRR